MHAYDSAVCVCDACLCAHRCSSLGRFAGSQRRHLDRVLLMETQTGLSLRMVACVGGVWFPSENHRQGCVLSHFAGAWPRQESLHFERTKKEVGFVEGRDMWMEAACANARPYCPPQAMDSEDTLFFLYTSGSTGKPKGIAHTQAGYLLYYMTQKYVFDNREGDVYACVADCGWITGHTYIVYGPLCNGGTTLMFESTHCTQTRPDTGTWLSVIRLPSFTQRRPQSCAHEVRRRPSQEA